MYYKTSLYVVKKKKKEEKKKENNFTWCFTAALFSSCLFSVLLELLTPVSFSESEIHAWLNRSGKTDMSECSSFSLSEKCNVFSRHIYLAVLAGPTPHYGVRRVGDEVALPHPPTKPSTHWLRPIVQRGQGPGALPGMCICPPSLGAEHSLHPLTLQGNVRGTA